MIKFRDYSNQDYNLIKNLLEECNLFDSNYDTKGSLENKIKKNPDSIILAELKEKVIGCVYIMEDGWAGIIWHLAVKKEHRKKGIGNLLMQEAEKRLKKKGYKTSTIFVKKEDKEVIDFYNKRGYKVEVECLSMYKML